MPIKNRKTRRRYDRDWMARRREAWIAANGPCICGATERLQVHHRDPAQKVSHKVWSWSNARREAELAKCVVRCPSCHLAEHGKSATLIHGTQSGYSYRGCRCAACTDAKRRYQNARRQRARARGAVPT